MWNINNLEIEICCKNYDKTIKNENQKDEILGVGNSWSVLS